MTGESAPRMFCSIMVVTLVAPILGGLFLPRAGRSAALAAMLGGESLDSALQALSTGSADGVVILENDLYNRAPAAGAAESTPTATNSPNFLVTRSMRTYGSA